jgi:phosphate transport system substrate-binding protein
MIIQRRSVLAGLAAVTVANAAPAWAQGLEGKLNITGASTLAPLVLEIAKAFEKANPKVRIDVQTGGSSRGVADARSGLADIGMVSRPLTATETDLIPTPVALDGICIILHKSNKLDSLTDAQIVDIYTGKITDWKDAGGTAGKISVVNKAEGRSTLDLFLSHFKLKNGDIKASVVIGDNAQGVKSVVAIPGSIGYVSIGTAEFEAEQGTLIKLLPIGGIKASTENVRNKSFPLSRTLNLVTKTKPEGLAKAFLDFATSPAALPFVKEQFFVPLQG